MTIRYFPEKFNVITSADDIGAILDLARITGEDLFSYKKRILESSERLANSSYQGLINGINRELGLERNDIIEIDLKPVLAGDLSHPEISYNLDTITDDRQYTGTINGVGITAVENKFTSNVHIWEPGKLVGLTISIDSQPYKILSNTTNSLTFDGHVSNTVGQTYLIFAYWEENSLSGLALEIGNRKYEILSNTNNVIKLDGPVVTNFGTEYIGTALRPRIQVTSSRIILYKEYLNEENFQLDLEIPLRERNIPHTQVVSTINSDSVFFKATDLRELESTLPAKTIKQQDSDVPVNQENVPGTKFFKLENRNIKSGTIKFSETGVFLREVPVIEDAPSGPYFYVDYKQGIVRAKTTPNGTGTVSYIASQIPFRLEATPAVVTPFVDDDADSFLFAQQEKLIYDDERDRFISSQPKSNMIEYIAELLKVTDQTWGK